MDIVREVPLKHRISQSQYILLVSNVLRLVADKKGVCIRWAEMGLPVGGKVRESMETSESSGMKQADETMYENKKRSRS